jgi:hypothetical protein
VQDETVNPGRIQQQQQQSADQFRQTVDSLENNTGSEEPVPPIARSRASHGSLTSAAKDYRALESSHASHPKITCLVMAALNNPATTGQDRQNPDCC